MWESGGLLVLLVLIVIAGAIFVAARQPSKPTSSASSAKSGTSFSSEAAQKSRDATSPRRIKTYPRAEQAVAQFKAVCEKHRGTLARKRRELVITDDYGRVDDSKWLAEVELFVNEIALPAVHFVDREYIKGRLEQLVFRFIEAPTKHANSAAALKAELPDNVSPYDYEKFCAEVLREVGWDANPTSGSGDQGVDVIASKSGYQVAIQCKLFTSPVGNKAVQEVVAARQHIGAQYAAVVTNSSYTPSAKKLAQTTGTLLLHHTDLPNLEFHLLDVMA